MLLIIGIPILLLLLIGLLLERFLVKQNWSNPFINTFYIFNMLFSSPFNVICACCVIIIPNILIKENTSVSLLKIVSFIILTTLIGLIVYFLWTRYKKLKISYQSLVDFSKMFIFRTPLLVITLEGVLFSILQLLYPDLYDEHIVEPIIFSSCFIMANGLYVVPLFILVKYFINKKINLRRK